MSGYFKTRNFSRWAQKAGITDHALMHAIREIQAGLIDADLGGGIIKKRVALPGRGKRGSIRTLLATNRDDRWFYVFGFEKNERDNITAKELDALRLYAHHLLKLTDQQIEQAISSGAIIEVQDET